MHVRQVHARGTRSPAPPRPGPTSRALPTYLSLVGSRKPEPHAVVVQPERLQHELRHLDAAAELVGHLLFGAEDVGVVLGEAAHAGHAVQLARLLEAIHRAELGQPQRQVAVAPRLRLVDRDVVRAVHRLEQVAARRLPSRSAGTASPCNTDSGPRSRTTPRCRCAACRPAGSRGGCSSP